jgi:hypothetical protein
MAFKLNGFNPGKGTGMGDAHMASHPNKIKKKVIKYGADKLDDAWKYFTKSKPKVNIKNKVDDVKPPKSNVPQTNKGPKGGGPKVDPKNFQRDVVSKLPKNMPKSKISKAFDYFMRGWLVADIVSMFTGGGDDDKGGDDQAIQDHMDNKNQGTGDDKTPPPPKKDPYAEAKKKDPNLDKHIAERDKHKKGTPEYDAAQNRINKAYGDKTRHGVKKTKGTKGRDTVSRLHVPGIVDKAKLERKRKIGGTKIIQQNVNLETGEHKERKTKGDKQKERFYDAEGNLVRKTKDKKNKQKDVTKTDHTVTKVKINKRTGKVKTKTRRRRGQKTGEFFKSLVGK